MSEDELKGLTEDEWFRVRQAAVTWSGQVLNGNPGPEPLLSVIFDIRRKAQEAGRAEGWDWGYRDGVRAGESGYVAGTERHLAAKSNPLRD